MVEGKEPKSRKLPSDLHTQAPVCVYTEEINRNVILNFLLKKKWAMYELTFTYNLDLSQ